MTYNIVVCDDEEMVCRALTDYLERYREGLPFQFNVTVCHSAEEYLSLRPATDILFLDIQMGEMDGIRLARTLRKENAPCIIIFITSMIQYALEGYEVHAFGFLPKPVAEPMLRMYLNDAIRSLTKKHGRRLELTFNADRRVVESNEILYFDSYGHRINVHTRTEVFPCVTSLAALEDELAGVGFFRCHNSFLINLKYVACIGRDSVELTGGENVPLSRHKRKLLTDSYLAYRSNAAE